MRIIHASRVIGKPPGEWTAAEWAWARELIALEQIQSDYIASKMATP